MKYSEIFDHDMLGEKIVHYRSTNSDAFYALQWMSLPPLPIYTTQIIKHFLTLRLSANQDKGLEL